METSLELSRFSHHFQILQSLSLSPHSLSLSLSINSTLSWQLYNKKNHLRRSYKHFLALTRSYRFHSRNPSFGHPWRMTSTSQSRATATASRSRWKSPRTMTSRSARLSRSAKRRRSAKGGLKKKLIKKGEY